MWTNPFSSIALFAALAFVAVSPAAFAQHLSCGVVGGVGLTGDFQTESYPGPGLTTEIHPNSNSYIVGPMLELSLPFHLAVEADGLYRPLRYTEELAFPNGSAFNYPATVITWEFPVLAKYRWPLPVVKPFAEAGPSFRAAGHVNTSFNPSNRGIALGGGVEVHLGKLKIAPELRYTRWATDSSFASGSVQAFTNPNQGELLVGLSF
ncbi:MAG: outer membrane beta-barrel protein [Bryobacteraceae bacterium]